MKIDFEKLSNLMKHKTPVSNTDTDESGIANVIYYIWNHYSVKNIDFNSFTSEDAKSAFDEFHFIPTNDEELSSLDYEHLKSNRWSILANNENLIFELVKSKKKIYVNDDDFI